jgi:hypothetical protein
MRTAPAELDEPGAELPDTAHNIAADPGWITGALVLRVSQLCRHCCEVGDGSNEEGGGIPESDLVSPNEGVSCFRNLRPWNFGRRSFAAELNSNAPPQYLC